MKTSKLTPLMTQYWDVKNAHPDRIVLFRMGDFFEMFHQDAETAAPVLGIALTSRNKKAADETPMCGFPHHSLGTQINKLLSRGFRVAICDQVEDPKLAKGLVKRAVTRVLSPGIVFDPESSLASDAPNYLAAMDAEGNLAFADIASGEAFYFSNVSRAAALRMILNLSVVEWIDLAESDSASASGFLPTDLPKHILRSVTTLSQEAPQNLPMAAQILFSYAIESQGTAIKHSLKFTARSNQMGLQLSPIVAKHLEVFCTYKGESAGSLFKAIDRCKTPGGSRLLRQRLQFPLTDLQLLRSRQQEVETWTKSPELLTLREKLARLGDVARRVSKLANPSFNPRDLVFLADSLATGVEISDATGTLHLDALDEVRAFVSKVRSVLVDEPPLHQRAGGIVRKGSVPELDDLIRQTENAAEELSRLENRERELTGIASLKVRFNSVFGYAIEISNAHKEKVPNQRYLRKQTLTGAERYTTEELTALESIVLAADARRTELEAKIFAELVRESLLASARWYPLCAEWAELDCASALAFLALERKYNKPDFVLEADLELKASRHPVLEQILDTPFVANDIQIKKSSCLLLTGPNMAGKSTLMRQVALTVILAQIGSFVPAEAAKLPVFSEIFTRIGASDSLTEGLSTFMVEMLETAEMLNSVGRHSLVVLDEIGRGTSTFDGLSLAQAILEFLLARSEAMVLFATHYHELTLLGRDFLNLHPAHMRILEKSGEIVFLHQLVQGAAEKSYGIQVAQKAGIPSEVTRRAYEILAELEKPHPSNFYQVESSPQLSLPLQAPEAAWMSELKKLDISTLTPLEALNRLASWQQNL